MTLGIGTESISVYGVAIGSFNSNGTSTEGGGRSSGLTARGVGLSGEMSRGRWEPHIAQNLIDPEFCAQAGHETMPSYVGHTTATAYLVRTRRTLHRLLTNIFALSKQSPDAEHAT